MKNRVNILNCPVDNVTMQQTLDFIKNAIVKREPIQHVVVNAAKLVYMQNNKELYDSVVNCDIINADGQSVVWASKILKSPLPERVTGIDLMENLVKMAHDNGFKLFFFGAKEDVVKSVVQKYSLTYSDNVIAGYRNGYFKNDEELAIAHQIGESGADILFVAISSPTKEIFLSKYKDIINIPFVMGVGGSFDVIAGKVTRAPKWMQKTGLEWFYRLAQEPRRMWKRYLVTNTIFVWLVFKQKFLNN